VAWLLWRVHLAPATFGVVAALNLADFLLLAQASAMLGITGLALTLSSSGAT
jgi:hypothetical protein